MRVLIIASALLVLLWSAQATKFRLSDRCPASFQKLSDGTCELVTLYSLYASVPQHGGLQVKVPQPPRHTPEQMDLGRYLFFDPVLSANRMMSCASCHDPGKGFSDGRKRAVGAVELDRSAPTLWNVALNDRFMWDGRAKTLEEQALLPLTNPQEMANDPAAIVSALNAIPAYVDLFRQAYGRAPDIVGLTDALAAFETSLISLNSRYDRYAYGDATALNEQEIRGHNVFRGFVARCSQCHIPPLFTDNELVVVGAPVDDRGVFDPGAGAHCSEPALKGAFKVPTLRNITRTAPYFNAGQFASLRDVIGFYNDTRGHAAPPGSNLKIHWHIHMMNGAQLSDRDVDDLIAFLGTLEDETMTPTIPKQLPSGLNLPQRSETK